MREIKFRAWQPHASLHRQPGMYLVDDMVWHNATDEQPEKGEVFLTRKIGTSRSSEFFEDVQIMQYTGLTDKYGKDIYEGDIISIPRGRTVSNRCVIEWDGSGWYVKPSDMRRTLWTVHNRVKVIGNIYENTELLEAKQ